MTAMSSSSASGAAVDGFDAQYLKCAGAFKLANCGGNNCFQLVRDKSGRRSRSRLCPLERLKISNNNASATMAEIIKYNMVPPFLRNKQGLIFPAECKSGNSDLILYSLLLSNFLLMITIN